MEAWYITITEKTEETARQGNYRDVYSAIFSLIRGIEGNSTSPAICKTDSIICGTKKNSSVSDRRLIDQPLFPVIIWMTRPLQALLQHVFQLNPLTGRRYGQHPSS